MHYGQPLSNYEHNGYHSNPHTCTYMYIHTYIHTYTNAPCCSTCRAYVAPSLIGWTAGTDERSMQQQTTNAAQKSDYGCCHGNEVDIISQGIMHSRLVTYSRWKLVGIQRLDPPRLGPFQTIALEREDKMINKMLT